jgi:hypothetical protein
VQGEYSFIYRKEIGRAFSPSPFTILPLIRLKRVFGGTSGGALCPPNTHLPLGRPGGELKFRPSNASRISRSVPCAERKAPCRERLDLCDTGHMLGPVIDVGEYLEHLLDRCRYLIRHLDCCHRSFF